MPFDSHLQFLTLTLFLIMMWSPPPPPCGCFRPARCHFQLHSTTYIRGVGRYGANLLYVGAIATPPCSAALACITTNSQLIGNCNIIIFDSPATAYPRLPTQTQPTLCYHATHPAMIQRMSLCCHCCLEA